MVPVAEQGASSRTASNGPPRHSATSAATVSADRSQAREILPKPLEALGRAIDRDDVRAGGGKLGGLAARGGAQIGDGAAGHVAEEPRRQRRRGVLHPPCAILVARQVLTPAHARWRAPIRSAVRVRRARSPKRPRRSSRSDRAPAPDGWRARWRVRPPSPYALDPTGHEPVRRIESGGVGAGQKLGAVAGDAAEHCVDETGITRGAAVRLHEPHRKIDGGVIGNLEPENLRGADQQRQSRLAARPRAGRVRGTVRADDRSVPSRRSTDPTRRRTNARSRSASAARPADRSSSCSSSGRRRRSTPSSRSAAIARAARPGGGGRGMAPAEIIGVMSHETASSASASRRRHSHRYESPAAAPGGGTSV